MSFLATLSLLAAISAPATVADAASARVIVYRNSDVPEIHTRVHFTTLIALPPGEQVLDYVLGDPDAWQLQGSSNFAYLTPYKDGVSSNITLTCASGNVYSFIVEESRSTAPDLKVIVQQAIERVERTPAPAPSPSPAPTAASRTLHFSYRFDTKNNPFHVSLIYEDGRFTYITCSSPEKPAIYEQTEDGTPGILNFTLEDGIYRIPKVVERGYLALGKKRFPFERVAR